MVCIFSGDDKVRIFVLVFGRSRSTSVILAYLIKRSGMSFEEAWKYINAGCWHLIDRTLIFEDQLREWERCERTRHLE